MATDEKTQPIYHTDPLCVTLHVGGGGRKLTGRSRDLSCRGIFVQTPESLSAGQSVEVLIEGGTAQAHDDVIATSGRIVHCLPGVGVGVRFATQNERTQKKIRDRIVDLQELRHQRRDLT